MSFPQFVEALSSGGHDVVHWQSIGPINAPDRFILDHARTDGRTIITHDLDFGALLAVGAATGPSVIICRVDDITPGHLAPVLIRILERFEKEIGSGALISTDGTMSRIRILPIKEG